MSVLVDQRDPRHEPLTAYCAKCKAETIPGISGRCLWCDTRIVKK